MPASPGRERPNRPLTPDRLAAWEAGAFDPLRRYRDLVTVVDDELPDEPMPGDPETRSALDRLRRA